MDLSAERIVPFLRNRTTYYLGGALAALVIAGAGFWAGRATAPVAVTVHAAPLASVDGDEDDTPEAAADTPAGTTAAPRAHGHRGDAAGAAVIAAATRATGAMYVHRNNSDLRKAPSYAAETIKKEPKGAKLEMVALSGKWAEVADGGITGWMRASVLKDIPPDAPGAKRARKKKDAAAGG
ncbi:MAG: hypothetical protein ACREHE_14875 [Rhizomicrobium sp.]